MYENTTAGEAQRISHIEQQFNSLEEAIKCLDGVVSELEQRLVPITRPSAPVPTSPGLLNKAPAEEILVPIAQRIKGIAGRVAMNQQHLQDILNRLEI